MDVENGEALGPEDIAEIHREADTDIRSKMKLSVNTRLVFYQAFLLKLFIFIEFLFKNFRNKKGDIEDFLETRRPFGHQEQPKH